MSKKEMDCNKEKEEAILDEIVTENPSEETVESPEGDNVTDWEAKFAELSNSYLRLSAEFDNYRKRTLKEKNDMFKSGSERVLLDVVSIVDDFERALEVMDKAEDVKALREGVDLIYNKFTGFLAKHHVKEIEALGVPFDTDLHEALTTIPAQNGEDKDKVIDCVQKGYTLDDKVIRYAKVIVAK